MPARSKQLVADSGHGPVAVIGTGGVGKAIAFALADLGVSEIRIFDTDTAKAEHLVSLLQNRQSIRMADSVDDAVRGAVGLVNGTPIGMLPNRDTPVPDALLHAEAVGRRCRLFAAVDAAAQRRQGQGRAR